MAWARAIKLGGGAYLWHYQPYMDNVKSFSELYAAWLLVDGNYGVFGFHFEPRFRDTKLRAFYQSNFWVQELYAQWTHPAVKFKVGKVYTQFGRGWDGSFYGNLAYFDGLKLDPNLGFSGEGKYDASQQTSISYALQYFPIDGRTNGSLTGRDTLWTASARKRNMVSARVMAALKLADETKVAIGVSGQTYRADFGDPLFMNDRVNRANVEAEVGYGPLLVYGELTRQAGRSVVAYPAADMVSARNNYVAGGVQYKWRWFAPRYNIGYVDYSDVGTSEILHQPGVTATVNDHLGLLVEYVYWRQTTSAGKATFDNSLNVIVYVSL